MNIRNSIYNIGNDYPQYVSRIIKIKLEPIPEPEPTPDSKPEPEPEPEPIDPLNPLGLPPYTIRVKYAEGYTPVFNKGTAVQVSESQNIWDLTYENTNWTGLLETNTNSSSNHKKLIEVLGANTTGVTLMSYMFMGDENLETLVLFDTSKVTKMESFCSWCTKLNAIPLFATEKVTNVSDAFAYCRSVQSGAYELWLQMSSQDNPPTRTVGCFYDCGASDNIPENDWKYMEWD